jgi:hypothetical protein
MGSQVVWRNTRLLNMWWVPEATMPHLIHLHVVAPTEGPRLERHFVEGHVPACVCHQDRCGYMDVVVLTSV